MHRPWNSAAYCLVHLAFLEARITIPEMGPPTQTIPNQSLRKCPRSFLTAQCYRGIFQLNLPPPLACLKLT